jgi:hypothetical protein
MVFPVVGPIALTFGPSYSLSRWRVQTVPATAPAGTYIYWGYVGTPPWIALDSDSFSFVKMGVSDGLPDDMGWRCYGELFPGEVENVSLAPSIFHLGEAHPNPFNPTTTITFQLPVADDIQLIAYDTGGRLISKIVEGWYKAGDHQVQFDGSNLPSGVYLYKLLTGQYSATGKMVLLK